MAENEDTKPKSALDELAEIKAEHDEEVAAIQVAAAKCDAVAGYTLSLYDPIMIGPQKVSSLSFRPPSIRDIRATKNEDELTASLCGLKPDELLQLSSFDYECTQAVLAGFHLRRAVGSRARKG